MKKYNVRFRQMVYYQCQVEAESEDEAKIKASEECEDYGYENCAIYDDNGIEFDDCWED